MGAETPHNLKKVVITLSELTQIIANYRQLINGLFSSAFFASKSYSEKCKVEKTLKQE